MTDEPEEDLTQTAIELAKSLHPMLTGKPAPVIGAALADLTSLWIAGHVAETPRRTRELQGELLEEHLKAVRKLIPMQTAMLMQRMEEPKERPN